MIKKANQQKAAFLALLILPFVSFGFSEQDLTKELTLRDIMGDPPIEGNRPTGAGFSPDSRYVTFFWNDAEGDKKTHLWVSPSDAGSPEILVDDFHGTFYWAEDSNSIMYVKKSNLYRTDIRTKKTSQLTNNDFFLPNFVPSPDNKKILISGDRENTKTYNLIFNWSSDGKRIFIDKTDEDIRKRSILLVKPGETEVRILYEEKDEKWIDNLDQISCWSKDGKRIFFTSEKDGFNHIYSLDPESGLVDQKT